MECHDSLESGVDPLDEFIWQVGEEAGVRLQLEASGVLHLHPDHLEWQGLRHQDQVEGYRVTWKEIIPFKRLWRDLGINI